MSYFISLLPQLYDDDPTKSGSRLCGCNQGPELKCTWLEEIEKKPCNTDSAFYSHASPFYLAYRGQCLCYSGEFICAKHDTAKGSKKGAKATGKLSQGSAESGYRANIMSLLWHLNVMVKVARISLHPASIFQIFATRLSGD